MTLPVHETVFAVFETDSPVSVRCFDCSFVSDVKRWRRVSSVIMNRRKNSTQLGRNIPKNLIETPPRRCFCSILRTCFSCSNFHSTFDAVHFVKCFPYLLVRALSVNSHSIPFCRSSSPFLTWSPHLVDHCLDDSYVPVLMWSPRLVDRCVVRLGNSCSLV